MKNQVRIMLPQPIYERAKQLADLRHQDVAELVADAIRLIDGTASPGEEQAMANEEKAYQAMCQDLLAQYADEYVAIYQGRLIDHDADELALLKRLDAHYPDEVVLMKQVLAKPKPELHFRSPRLIRD